jgi:uncharacterized protein
MRQIVPMILFLSIFSFILFGMNFYVVGSIFALYNMTSALLVSIILTILYPTSMLVAQVVSNKGTYYLNKAMNIWLGIIFIGLWIIATLDVLEIAGVVLPRHIHLSAILLLATIGVIGTSSYKIQNVSLHTIKIKQPIRIVQLTDVHLHGHKAKRRLESLLAKVKEQKPDVLVITGDVIDNPGLPEDDTFAILKEWKIPVLITFGNHEFYVGEQHAMRILGKYAKVLRNTTLTFKDIQFVGIDDPQWGLSLRDHMEQVKVDEKKFVVLLYHRPTSMEVAHEAGVDLMLSGHTHNGQMFPFNFLVKLQFPLIKGLYEIGNMRLYVSQGTGTWGPPLRIGSQNEITVIDILPKSS